MGYIQTTAMAQFHLQPQMPICFLWTKAVDCSVLSSKFYQESRKKTLRCRARNFCEKISVQIQTEKKINGVLVCDGCSFFEGMCSEYLNMLNRKIEEIGFGGTDHMTELMAKKFEITVGLSGHLIDFEDSPVRPEAERAENSNSTQETGRAGKGEVSEVELKESKGEVIKKAAKEDSAKIHEELKAVEEVAMSKEAESKKVKGPVGHFKIVENGKNLWEKQVHFSTAHKKAREYAEEGRAIELYKGTTIVPPERWLKGGLIPNLIPKSKLTTNKQEEFFPGSFDPRRLYLVIAIVPGKELQEITNQNPLGSFFSREISGKDLLSLAFEKEKNKE